MNIDGITSVTVPISEYIALSLIRNLEMLCAVNQYTTETKFSYFKEIRGLVIKVKYKQSEGFSLIITGSLHKYFHGVNNNDFYEHELEQVKREIFQYFAMDIVEFSRGKIKPVPAFLLPLNKVEVGFNIEMAVDDIYAFLKDNLQQHRKRLFTNDDGFMFICKHEHYYLKLYCKAPNMLRFEIVLLTRELKKYGISTLSDLTNEKITPLLSRIKMEAAEIIFSDGINLHTAGGLSKREELKLLRYTSKWRDNDYKLDKKKASKRLRKNMYQKMWRLGIECKNILGDKGCGYKQIFVASVNDKIDTFLLKNDQLNANRF